MSDQLYIIGVVCSGEPAISVRARGWEVGRSGELVVFREDGAVCVIAQGQWDSFVSKETKE